MSKEKSLTKDKSDLAIANQPKQRQTDLVNLENNRSDAAAQLKLQGSMQNDTTETVQRQPNKTGLPDKLKSGMEQVSGMNLDHVRTHYNSPKPAAVQAHAYAQGSNIHIVSGQEKHLSHELGHVVQQAQGRVKPTTTVNGMAVNDSPALEKEADSLGAKAMSAS